MNGVYRDNEVMKIYLIRHGESESDVKERYDGDYDDHLMEKGIRDAHGVAERLLKVGVQVVFSSPKIRAMETAEILKRALKCEVVVKDDLKEQDIYGAYPELSAEYPEEEYRRLGELLAKRDVSIDGVESYEGFRKRVADCFSEIVETGYDAIAIVTHGGPIRCILQEAGTSEYKKIGNGTIIELEKTDDKFVVVDGKEE